MKKMLAMKKMLLTLSAAALSLSTLHAAAPPRPLEDTSLVRISSPEARAEFLNKMMNEKLRLGDQEAARLAEINAKFEKEVQQLTVDNPAVPGLKAKRGGGSIFDKLSEARYKEVKKALTGGQYKDYEKWAPLFRTELGKQMKADKVERDRKERAEEEARLAALEKARADSIAAAAKKPVKGAAAAGKKTPAKAPAKTAGKKGGSSPPKKKKK